MKHLHEGMTRHSTERAVEALVASGMTSVGWRDDSHAGVTQESSASLLRHATHRCSEYVSGLYANGGGAPGEEDSLQMEASVCSASRRGHVAL